MDSRSFAALAAASLALASSAAAQGLHVSRVSTRPDGRQIGPFSAQLEHAGTAQSISDDGRFVIITELVNDNPPPYPTFEMRLVDRADGSQGPIVLGTGGAPLDRDIGEAVISRDGLRIHFTTPATNLPGGLSQPNGGLFVLERATGVLRRVTHGLGGAQPTSAILYRYASPDGRFVSFWSVSSNLVPNDTNSNSDAFLADMLAGTTTRVSVGTGGVQSIGNSQAAPCSADGRYVLFVNDGDDLSPNDNNGSYDDVYLRDLLQGTSELISVTPAGVSGDVYSWSPWMSADARYVAFLSQATNLVPGDLNGFEDVFVRDRQSGTTTMLLLSSTATQLDDDFWGLLTPSGRHFVFESPATNVVPGDTNQASDLFVHDRVFGTTERISLTPLGGQAILCDSPQTGPFISLAAVSADARFVAGFGTYSDLVEGDSNGAVDGFVLDRQSAVGPVTTYCAAKTTSSGCVPVITSAGEPRATGLDSFYVSATKVRTATRGAFIWSLASASTPFGGGTLCIATPYALEPVASGTYGGTPHGPCNQGQFLFKVSHNFLSAHALAPGTTLFAQFLSRDNGFAPPFNIGLTDAIAFTVAP